MKTSTLFKCIALFVLLLLAIIFPQVVQDPTLTSIGYLTLSGAAAATGWNLFSGYTGYLALGGGAYFGFGAYTLALVCQHWKLEGGYPPLSIIPLGGLVAAIAAIPLGWISLHTRKATFIVITIATLFIFQLLAYNLTGITHGFGGLNLPTPPANWNAYFYNIPFYYSALLILVLALATSWWVRNSKYGLGLLAIRDDEDRALGLGIKTESYKLSAFVISAFFLGMIGALNIYYNGSITPPGAFTPVFGTAVALVAFLGGIGTLSGPILGALILEPLNQFLIITFGSTGLDTIVYGVLLLVVLLYLPEGIVPGMNKFWAYWQRRRGAPVLTAESGQPEHPQLVESTRGRE